MSVFVSCLQEAHQKCPQQSSSPPPRPLKASTITSYQGIVTGEAIMGANIFKDLFAGIRDIVGGRSATYERELRRARELAMEEMKHRARPSWAPTRWSASTSTTRPSAPTPAC